MTETFDAYHTYYSDIPREWIPIICPPDRVSLFDYNGAKVPCISLDDRHYDQILRYMVGEYRLLETNLDIFDNLKGRVFVRMTVNVPPADSSTLDTSKMFHEVFLLNARLHLDFFKALADTTMFGFLPEHDYDPTADNITLVQLPRPDKAMESLKLIQRGLGAATDI